MVKRQGGEFRRDIRAAEDDRDFTLLEGAADHAGDEGGGGGGEFRGFDDAAVARGDDAGQRGEGEVDREVPGAEHADHAERHIVNAGFGVREHAGVFFRLHPFGQVVAGEFEFIDAAQDVCHQGELAGAAAEILGDGVDDFVLVVDQHADEAVQPVNALVGGEDAVLEAGLFLRLQQCVHAGNFGGGGGCHVIVLLLVGRN